MFEVESELGRLRVTVNELRNWSVVVVRRAIVRDVIQGRVCSGPLRALAAFLSLAHRYNSAWRRCVWWYGRDASRRWVLECRIRCPSTVLGVWMRLGPALMTTDRVTFRFGLL